MTTSPPKPWERQAAEAKAAAAGVSSQQGAVAVTPANSGETNAPLNSVAPSSSSTSPLGTRYGMPGSSYGGSMYNSSPYGSSMYGSSVYGSSMYGNGGYGGSMYGNSFGRYGSGYGGYGSNMGSYGGYSGYGGSMGGYGGAGFGIHGQKMPGAPFTNALVHNGQSFIEGVHQHVSSFGRFSQILHMNFEALHMSFSSILQLLSNASILRQEFGAIFSTFGGLRVLYLIYAKARNIVLRLLGRQADANRHELSEAWSSSKGETWGWMPILLTASFVAWILKRLYNLMQGTRRTHQNPRAPFQSPPTATPHSGMPSQSPLNHTPSQPFSPMSAHTNPYVNSFPSPPYQQQPFGGHGDGFADYNWGD